MRSFPHPLAIFMVVLLAVPAQAAVDVKPLLKTLLAVGPKGAGNREATRAWAALVRADAEQLPAILAALNDARPPAANWIRTAVDAIAERQLRSGGKLPAAELERFVLDTRHAGRARRLAYELLIGIDAAAPQRLIGGMLDDPSVEIRRDAVVRLIDNATALEKAGKLEKAVAGYQKAFSAARDFDQVKSLAAKLRKLGKKVDLPRHFGFVVRWKLIGPFDNTDEKGFAVAYPPERQLDTRAACKGKQGEVRWIDHVSQDDYGKVDLNKVFGEQKDVIAYAASDYFSDKHQEVEIRVSSYNALKLWLNGKLIDQHNFYHAGSQLDQYVAPAALRPGRNVILLKVCQNRQPQSWAKWWSFQLRVCDATGGGVLSTDRDR